ncbi:MAG TPA: class I SAM-dependent methyltransferase, partial [Rhodanobacteraceae bacterium]|nr:class I SAM-dependent methyltransferase [Rhodanobacteraceae bacterium]
MTDVANEAIIARISARYRLQPHRSYARGKLRWDPIFAAAASLFAESRHALLDIGCGLGLLGQYLRECGCSAPYRGIDLDER